MTHFRNSQSDGLEKLFDDKTLNLILVRHGQAGGNGVYKDFEGAALSVTGEQQAELVAARLGCLSLDSIYSSDMARAYQTAEAVCSRMPTTPFRCLPDIREISSFHIRGRRQSRTRDERALAHEQRERVHGFAAHLKQSYSAGQVVAIIAHNGLNGMLLSALLGVPYRKSIFFHSSHTGITVANVSLADSTASLRLMGCTRHLPPDLITDTNIKNP